MCHQMHGLCTTTEPRTCAHTRTHTHTHTWRCSTRIHASLRRMMLRYLHTHIHTHTHAHTHTHTHSEHPYTSKTRSRVLSPLVHASQRIAFAYVSAHMYLTPHQPLCLQCCVSVLCLMGLSYHSSNLSALVFICARLHRTDAAFSSLKPLTVLSESRAAATTICRGTKQGRDTHTHTHTHTQVDASPSTTICVGASQQGHYRSTHI